MLETIELKNFKSHQLTQLNFDNSRLHALVGKNSSGKTSILQALYYFNRLTESDIRHTFIIPEILETLVMRGKDNFSVKSSGLFGTDKKTQNWEISYEFHRTEDSLGLIRPKEWLTTLSWNLGSEPMSYKSFRGDDAASFMNAPSIIPQIFKFTTFLKLVANKLVKPAYSEAIIPQIEIDGYGLAPTLDYLRNESSERFETLQGMLRQIVPGVLKVGIRRAKVPIERERLIEVDGRKISYQESQEITGQEIVLDMNTGERIPASAISEGTMLALGLLTVLMAPEPPNLILLDDLEQGLHPHAQRELIDVLKEILQVNQNLQIIFSTHSPYIIDELIPSQVHVLGNTSSGITRVKRLDEHPDIEWAKQTLTTGEFWDAEGEDWVLAGEVNA